ncbi:hypothetical protein PGT21_028100 [Puccinia graminis f. sp. tritici]|uniref:NAD(P)H-hydrate epimerase n=2 Tax=Puccinia graminis f. sp. tritici TaxID=56615 RepID=NNRE_PUCGT|nr:YjeF [Puccinia graminis f. sp. tritici CRL 75-36-700-3]E3KGP2.2 RecName: Full=NAD(P)H-hydrate epimerase; AltName: Full=NAD(P)HX epimerase [Puccinia graminis f. sp. tritici CRL 75-36-700-3]EFP83467.2 YjeF [Puccinia graminis f. sp. tritici CRL 75-36-700-3]KAA1078074.1 hypothetical protein PGT21_028100 [Puccinia graminis f. sp. tritici]
MKEDSTMTYLTQKEAQEIDAELMGPKYGYTLAQLMELAGLACAQALHKVYGPERYPRVLVCCGPGNQGGDGLVAARHLWHFGHKPTLYYPKQTDKEHYKSLLRQCETLGIPVIGANFSEAVGETDVILDAIFGFSFHSEPRAPFDEPIRSFQQTQTPIVSVDIPSGWDVETGNPNHVYFTPNVLVSLTAPKRGVKSFPGRHFLGGRFIPPGIVKSYNLKLPCYPSSDQVVEITAVQGEDK